MTLSVWDDSFNGSSQVGSFTEAMSGTYTDIQYLTFANQGSGNSVRQLSATVDDLRFCDGVTSWASCPMQGEIGTVLSFETQEAPTTSTTTYLDDDFSSDNWSHDGNQVSSGGLDFNFNRSGTTHKSTYDLGQVVVEDFTMRFDFTPSSFT